MCYPSQQRVYDACFFLVKLGQGYTQTLELRLTFFVHFKSMTFNRYLTKSKSMLEWKLISMLGKNTEFVCHLIIINLVNILYSKTFVIFILVIFYLKNDN